jgi:hypothetical protein
MHAAVVGMKSLTKEFVSFTFGHKSEVNEGISDHALRTTRLGLEVRDPEHLRWRRTVEPNERGAMFGRTTHDHGGRRDRLPVRLSDTQQSGRRRSDCPTVLLLIIVSDVCALLQSTLFHFSILRTFRLLRVFRPFRYNNALLIVVFFLLLLRGC